MSFERRAVGAERRFDFKRAQGDVAEDWHESFINGKLSYEVKYDMRSSDTGNVYIERESQGKFTDEYHPSGIDATEADIWVFVLAPSWSVQVPVPIVRKIADENGKPVECKISDCPTRGVIVSIITFLRRSIQLCNEMGWPE